MCRRPRCTALSNVYLGQRTHAVSDSSLSLPSPARRRTIPAISVHCTSALSSWSCSMLGAFVLTRVRWTDVHSAKLPHPKAFTPGCCVKLTIRSLFHIFWYCHTGTEEGPC